MYHSIFIVAGGEPAPTDGPTSIPPALSDDAFIVCLTGIQDAGACTKRVINLLEVLMDALRRTEAKIGPLRYQPTKDRVGMLCVRKIAVKDGGGDDHGDGSSGEAGDIGDPAGGSQAGGSGVQAAVSGVQAAVSGVHAGGSGGSAGDVPDSNGIQEGQQATRNGSTGPAAAGRPQAACQSLQDFGQLLGISFCKAQDMSLPQRHAVIEALWGASNNDPVLRALFYDAVLRALRE